MSHTCHWPGCTREVPPKMWGCRGHWFRLPGDLRAKVWNAYEPGQEVTKTPSARYIAVAHEVHEWCLRWIDEHPEADKPLPVKQLTLDLPDPT